MIYVVSENKTKTHAIDLIEFMTFNNWGNETYAGYIRTLSPAQFTEVVPVINKSVKGILYHIYHSYWGEFHLITDRDWSTERSIDEMDMEDILKGIKTLNEQILNYIKENPVINKPFNYNEPGFEKPIKTNVEVVLLNFIEHTSYHRGQLALLLKYHKVKELDDVNYNPYTWDYKQ